MLVLFIGLATVVFVGGVAPTEALLAARCIFAGFEDAGDSCDSNATDDEG